MIWELKLNRWRLLQPERINVAAQALTQILRAVGDERGCTCEDELLAGDLDY